MAPVKFAELGAIDAARPLFTRVCLDGIRDVTVPPPGGEAVGAVLPFGLISSLIACPSFEDAIGEAGQWTQIRNASGRGAVVAHLLWEQGVAGSSPVAPTIAPES
jgi:hypothetical protein